MCNKEKNIAVNVADFKTTVLVILCWNFGNFAYYSEVCWCMSGTNFSLIFELLNDIPWGRLGGAKVSCILLHRGVQLLLTYSWARPAILVGGKDRGGNAYICSLSFLFLFLSCPSLSSLLLSLLCLFSLSLGDDTKWPTRVDMSLNFNTIIEYV